MEAVVFLRGKHTSTPHTRRSFLDVPALSVQLDLTPAAEERPAAAARKLVVGVDTLVSVACDLGQEGVVTEETLEDPLIAPLSKLPHVI